jgi:bifunctional DNase/RNase
LYDPPQGRATAGCLRKTQSAASFARERSHGILGPMEVRVDLATIVISETRDHQLIILRERNGPRTLPIVIGLPEALAIDRRVKGQLPKRPMTHDLLANVIEQLNAELEKIVINDLQDSTFFAKLVLRHRDGLVEVDSRPSDAIALGVAEEAAIFVEDHILNQIEQQE